MARTGGAIYMSVQTAACHISESRIMVPTTAAIADVNVGYRLFRLISGGDPVRKPVTTRALSHESNDEYSMYINKN